MNTRAASGEGTPANDASSATVSGARAAASAPSSGSLTCSQRRSGGLLARLAAPPLNLLAVVAGKVLWEPGDTLHVPAVPDFIQHVPQVDPHPGTGLRHRRPEPAHVHAVAAECLDQAGVSAVRAGDILDETAHVVQVVGALDLDLQPVGRVAHRVQRTIDPEPACRNHEHPVRQAGRQPQRQTTVVRCSLRLSLVQAINHQNNRYTKFPLVTIARRCVQQAAEPLRPAQMRQAGLLPAPTPPAGPTRRA